MTHSQRLRATRRSLRWWIISAKADLPPEERTTKRFAKKEKPCTPAPTSTTP